MAQVTNPGQFTTQRVICPPGTEHKEIYEFDKIHSLKEYISRDGGETYEKKFTYPASMDSKRLQICYKEQGSNKYVRHFMTYNYRDAIKVMNSYRRYPPTAREDNHKNKKPLL